MLLSDGIRRIGFRKWYERTLLASHAHLVLCFLCLIGVFAAFEACHFLIDWLKTKAPFWKLEENDQGANWVAAKDSDDDAARRWSK
jgi:molybdopterin synthase catalytic subunit